nr:hypothetical protein [Geotalea toluenoxydans]
MQLSFNRTNKEIDEAIDSLIGKAGGVHHQELVREMIVSALKAGQDTDYLAT